MCFTPTKIENPIDMRVLNLFSIKSKKTILNTAQYLNISEKEYVLFILYHMVGIFMKTQTHTCKLTLISRDR